jgi:aldehyde:ferredoxin oxidoreductase
MLGQALQVYYRLMGWNPDGIPEEKELVKLRLDWSL